MINQCDSNLHEGAIESDIRGTHRNAEAGAGSRADASSKYCMDGVGLVSVSPNSTCSALRPNQRGGTLRSTSVSGRRPGARRAKRPCLAASDAQRSAVLLGTSRQAKTWPISRTLVFSPSRAARHACCAGALENKAVHDRATSLSLPVSCRMNLNGGPDRRVRARTNCSKS